MHSRNTRDEFLRLRLQGLSFSTIGRHLGVSKPTLIAWNRQSQAELDSRQRDHRNQVLDQLAASADHDLADLQRKLKAIRQELFSRAVRDLPTSALETLAGVASIVADNPIPHSLCEKSSKIFAPDALFAVLTI